VGFTRGLQGVARGLQGLPTLPTSRFETFADVVPVGAPRRRASLMNAHVSLTRASQSRHAFTTATIEARCNLQGRCPCSNSHRSASSVARVSRASFSRAPETAPHNTTPLP
jgi:hypothetical protein